MIYLGADHGGYKLKEAVKEWLEEWDYQFEDCGAFQLDMEDDYPDFAFAVVEKMSLEAAEAKAEAKGILVCRSAAGMVIAANKKRGIRAAAGRDVKSVRHARVDNNINVLAVAGDWTKEEEAKKMIKTFLETKFSGEERHVRRLKKIREFV